MIRRLFLIFILVLNFLSLSAHAELADDLKFVNKKVLNSGSLNYSENCNECQQNVSETSTLYSPQNKKSIELSVLSSERALEVFNRLKNDEDIPFNYPLDGCYARAHKMAMIMDDMGITSGKAFIEGNLYVKTKLGEVGWSYHVASVVLVRKNGKLIPTIIDPSLFDKPVAYEDWKNLILKIKKANSKVSSEYYTKRFNYDPESRHADLIEYNEDEVYDMNSTNRSNRRLGEMMEMSEDSKPRGSKK